MYQYIWGGIMKIFLILFICLFICSGCGQSIEKDIKNNLADIREIMYEDKNDNFNISLVCGQREEDYVLNGKATPLIPFGIITFSDGVKSNDVEYKVFLDDCVLEGVLQKNPFEENYMADLGMIIDKDKVNTNIISDGEVYEFVLNRVDKSFKYNAEDIIKKISREYKDIIKLFYEDRRFCGEVYLKIITDSIANDKFWYFNIISTNGKSFAVVMSPETLEVLSLQKNL